MNDLKVFQNTEFGELGILMIDGKEYFPATQCAKILGYTNPQEAIRMHCKGVRKTLTPTNGGTQPVNYIPEGDLYRLIVSSKLPTAEKFERWVFDEVLPAIRKTGTYGDINLEELIARTATAVVSEVIQKLVPVFIQSVGIETKQPPVPKFKKPRRRTSVIARLDPEIQKTVDEMLLSNQFTYTEIADYLTEFGIRLSATSIWRYNTMLHGLVINEED